MSYFDFFIFFIFLGLLVLHQHNLQKLCVSVLCSTSHALHVFCFVQFTLTPFLSGNSHSLQQCPCQLSWRKLCSAAQRVDVDSIIYKHIFDFLHYCLSPSFTAVSRAVCGICLQSIFAHFPVGYYMWNVFHTCMHAHTRTHTHTHTYIGTTFQ